MRKKAERVECYSLDELDILLTELKRTGVNDSVVNAAREQGGERRLGLTEPNYATSEHLRSWCEHNLDRCYVPEWLLKRWGMAVDPNAA
jgi:hypothetical protein